MEFWGYDFKLKIKNFKIKMSYFGHFLELFLWQKFKMVIWENYPSYNQKYYYIDILL